MKIGKIKLEGKLILAPMYLITDAAFRELCKNNGASLVYSEMVSADAILKNNKKTLDMIKTTTKQRPFAIQLFGSNPEKLAKAAKKNRKKGKYN